MRSIEFADRQVYASVNQPLAIGLRAFGAKADVCYDIGAFSAQVHLMVHFWTIFKPFLEDFFKPFLDYFCGSFLTIFGPFLDNLWNIWTIFELLFTIFGPF